MTNCARGDRRGIVRDERGIVRGAGKCVVVKLGRAEDGDTFLGRRCEDL